MIKKIALALVFPIAAMGMTACGTTGDDREYVGVCVDPNTQERLPDNYCERGDSHFMQNALIWYMLANSQRSYPPVGGHVTRSHFRTSLPKTYKSKTHFGLPKSGGKSVKSYSSKTTWGKSSFGSGSSKSGSSWGKSSGSGYKPKSYSGGSSFRSGRR